MPPFKKQKALVANFKKGVEEKGKGKRKGEGEGEGNLHLNEGETCFFSVWYAFSNIVMLFEILVGSIWNEEIM